MLDTQFFVIYFGKVLSIENFMTKIQVVSLLVSLCLLAGCAISVNCASQNPAFFWLAIGLFFLGGLCLIGGLGHGELFISFLDAARKLIPFKN